MTERVCVIHGDSREALREIADASLDACVTDPPYALVSIGKRFGAEGAAPAKSEGASGVYARASAGFMGQRWDTGETAFDPAFWREVLRVLKPGAHVIAFGGTRTYHRLACAIEDAGFELRDMIAWLYGSGFPKSHDVSKGIDKAAGIARPVLSTETVRDMRNGHGRAVGEGIHAAGRAGGPTYMERAITGPASPDAVTWEGWGTALKPALEPIVLARKPLIGTVVATVLKHGTGALNIDACRIAAERPTGWGGAAAGGQTWTDENCGLAKDGAARPVDGRWPANVVHDGSEEVVEHFPVGKVGALMPHHKRSGGSQIGTFEIRARTGEDLAVYGDEGSAARFFYSAKADAADRLRSKHPTVKPVDLMAWLIRLVTPPGGTVLDPFAGSGSTGMAALREGFNAILIEREAAFVADIRRRIDHVSGADAPLFGGVMAADADTPPVGKEAAGRSMASSPTKPSPEMREAMA